MPMAAQGYIERLPSGSWRARVYVGIDPITRREIRLKATAKTERQAQIELGRLLKEASEGRTPEAIVTASLDGTARVWDPRDPGRKLAHPPLFGRGYSALGLRRTTLAFTSSRGFLMFEL